MSRGLLSSEAAVRLLTARKTRPDEVRVAAVLARLADQEERDWVLLSVRAHWAPLPAQAKARARRRARRPVPVEAWGPGVQLALPVGVEVEF